MRIRHAVVAGVLALAGSPALAADPPKPAEYARVEVRAKLYVSCPAPIRQPDVWWYAVSVGRDKDRQDFRLDLPTRALSDRAKELNGAVVVVAGDLEPGAGDSRWARVVRVTSLQRADPPGK